MHTFRSALVFQIDGCYLLSFVFLLISQALTLKTALRRVRSTGRRSRASLPAADPDAPNCPKSIRYWVSKPKEESGKEGTAFQAEVGAAVDPAAAISAFAVAPQAAMPVVLPNPAAMLVQIPAAESAASAQNAPTRGRGRMALRKCRLFGYIDLGKNINYIQLHTYRE